MERTAIVRKKKKKKKRIPETAKIIA